MSAHAIAPSSSSTRLNDPMSDLEASPAAPLQYPFYWYDQVTSTMDQAKELLQNKSQLKSAAFFAVGAERQLRGRGTRGRVWQSPPRNLMITIAVRRDILPIPIMLLPLRIGTLLASCISSRIDDYSENSSSNSGSDSKITLKWPNDLLIDGSKVCGTLIELDGDHLLIGIGCNVVTAPLLQATREEGDVTIQVRPATCLAAHSKKIAATAAAVATTAANAAAAEALTTDNSESSVIDVGVDSSANVASGSAAVGYSEGRPVLQAGDFHKELALSICSRVHDWLQQQSDSAELVHSDVTRCLDTQLQRLRDEADDAKAAVLPLRLNADGTLLVRRLHDGAEVTLVAEYLW